jgi:hypothetical protein
MLYSVRNAGVVVANAAELGGWRGTPVQKTVLGAVAVCAGAPLMTLGVGASVAWAAPQSGGACHAVALLCATSPSAGASPDLLGAGLSAPTPNALAAAVVSGYSFQPIIGPGGWLIGNGGAGGIGVNPTPDRSHANPGAPNFYPSDANPAVSVTRSK